MIKTICGRLIHLVVAIMLLQSCEREIDKYPVADETELVKKWYSENGKPFALEWGKSEIIKGNNETTTIIVPLENGLNIWPENATLQNIIFTIDEYDVVKGNKVDLFSDIRTITEHSKEAISSFVKKQRHKSQDLGKVYFIVYDFKDVLLYSEMLDAKGLKSINLRMTSQKKISKLILKRSHLPHQPLLKFL